MKKLFNLLIALESFFLIAGCGTVINFPDSKKDKDDDNDKKEEQTQTSTSVEQNSPKSFAGYVVSAFTVTVDGESFEDMEDFYTKELARLPEKVKSAGFNESWETTFEAEVGFHDLWHNMTVFAVPAAPEGYQTETMVGEDGGFSSLFPAEALEASYKVRANKRINIILAKGEEKKKLCYNFSAIEQEYYFSRTSLPVILDNFVTKITSYACTAENSGITIPEAGGQTPTKLALGINKSDTLRVLGMEGLSVSSKTKWCWSVAENGKGACELNVSDSELCECYVEFDENGGLSNFSNINKKYL